MADEVTDADREALSERGARMILDLEAIAQEEGGCVHIKYGVGETCWHCLKARYESVIRPLVAEARREGYEQGDQAWRKEAERWDAEVKEFDHPIGADHVHHEIRDWLNDAFAQGEREGRRKALAAVLGAMAPDTK